MGIQSRRTRNTVATKLNEGDAGRKTVRPVFRAGPFPAVLLVRAPLIRLSKQKRVDFNVFLFLSTQNKVICFNYNFKNLLHHFIIFKTYTNDNFCSPCSYSKDFGYSWKE